MKQYFTEVRCEGTMHRIAVDENMDGTMFAHSDKTIRSFAAFGVPAPACKQILEQWKADPMSFFFGLASSERGPDVLARIVGDWVEHARNAASTQRKMLTKHYADWTFLIEQARDVWADKLSPKEFRHIAFHLPPAETFADQAAAEYVESVMATPSRAHKHLRHAQFACIRAVTEGHPYPDATTAAEYKWQVAHGIRALVSLQEGTPWPAL